MSEITLILSRTPLHEFILSAANDTNREFDGLWPSWLAALPKVPPAAEREIACAV